MDANMLLTVLILFSGLFIVLGGCVGVLSHRTRRRVLRLESQLVYLKHHVEVVRSEQDYLMREDRSHAFTQQARLDAIVVWLGIEFVSQPERPALVARKKD